MFVLCPGAVLFSLAAAPSQMASEQPRPRGAERTIRTRASVTSPCFWFIMIHVSNTDYFPVTNLTSGNDILMHNYFC